MTDETRVEKQDTELTQAQLDEVAGRGSLKAVSSARRERSSTSLMYEEIGVVFHT